MMQNPLVQLVFFVVALWTVFTLLLKTPFGKWLLLLVVIFAALGAAVIYLIRYRQALARKLYQKPGCKHFIDLICKITKEQPPVDAKMEQAALLLKEPEDFGRAAEQLKTVVRGHDGVIDMLTDQLALMTKLRSRTVTAVRKPPLGVFLFAGNEGVGKTYLATALNKLMFSSGGLLILDMRDYRESAAASAALFGSSEKPGKLVSAVRAQPYHTVVLENIDACPADVVEQLRKALASGGLVEGASRVSFENAVFVFTTGGAPDVLAAVHRNAKDQREWLKRAEQEIAGATPLSATFLSLVNDIYYFAPPDELTKAEVILLLMQRECNNHRIVLDYVDPEVLAEEVVSVSDAHGFSLTPKRIERLLREPLLRAAGADQSRLVVDKDVMSPSGAARADEETEEALQS